MSKSLKKWLPVLISMILNIGIWVVPLFILAGQYADKAMSYQSLSEFFFTSSYEDWASDAKQASAFVYTVGVFELALMMICPIWIICSSCNNHAGCSKVAKKMKELPPIIITAGLLLISAILFAAGWMHHTTSNNLHNRAMTKHDWAQQEEIERISDLYKQLSGTFEGMSSVYQFWAIATFVFAVITFIVFIRMVCTREVKGSFKKLKGNQSRQQSADEVDTTKTL
jgi:hypothetical protein